MQEENGLKGLSSVRGMEQKNTLLITEDFQGKHCMI